MFVENIKSDFYTSLLSEHIVVMVHYDLDAICAYRILQTLFRYDNVSHSLMPIYGVSDLVKSYRENVSLFRHFVLINCGGCVDLVDLLDPVDERSMFYVIDSHRPFDVCNVYNSGQIRMVCSPHDVEDIPKFNDIFSEDDIEGGDGEDVDDEEEEEDGKSGSITEEKLLKKRERRLWNEKREKILMEYTQFSYYSKSSSIFMYELAWKLSRDSKDLLWLSIVGVTEQYLLGKIDNDQYELEVMNLQSHVTRLTNRTNNISFSSKQISFENDLRLFLLRHWTVESSLKYSPLTSCNLRLWSQKGETRLKDLLVEVGIPLVQSRQNFRSMELRLRKEFQESIESVSQKYNINNVRFSSFFLQSGHRSRYSASDYVLAAVALLESIPLPNLDSDNSFQETVDCFQNLTLVETGIEKAKVLLVSIFQQVQVAISTRLIKTAGPFVYYIISEEFHEWHLFSHPHSLSLLAHFLLRAYCSMSKSRKSATYPLIICSPINPNESIVVGIPPLLENSPRNFLGKAFEQISQKTNCEISGDFFDSTFVKLKTKDRSKFLDALTSLLI